MWETDDIEAIIVASKYYKYKNLDGVSSLPFHKLSSLSESKKSLKKAIKERIKLLAASYISLATFIDDDLLDSAEESQDEKQIKKIYKRVLKDMEKLRKEMEDFEIFDTDLK